MRDQIDLIVLQEQKKVGGLSLAVVVSLVLHSLLILFALRSWRPATLPAAEVPIARYVDLVKQNPREFVEAPGPKLDRPVRPDAPLSDANRKASAPEPTGDRPTPRPGPGGAFAPAMGQPAGGPQQRAQQPSPRAESQEGAQPEQTGESTDSLTFRSPAARNSAPAVDWRSAIRDAARTPPGTGGIGGFDPGNPGGEPGFAEQGPLSFETQWFEWGDYAQQMVSKIRVNWYANMPQIIRTGIGGVVTIRFTILRDGRITNVEILKESGVPPYDFAARKAIELSSPLAPLPKNFPNPSERVTCVFYYNTPVPAGR